MDVLEQYCLAVLGDARAEDDTASQQPRFFASQPLSCGPGLGDGTEDPALFIEHDTSPRKHDPSPCATALETIAFICNKGGTGKTTACVNIAGWLGKMGKRVLVIDLDPQGSATQALGLKPETIHYGVADALLGLATINSTIYDTPCGIQLIPAQPDLLLAERKLIFSGRSSAILGPLIASLTTEYDHILVDAPAGHGLLTLNAVTACSRLVLPLDASSFSANSSELLLEMFEQIETMLGRRLEIHALLLRDYAGNRLARKLQQPRQHYQRLLARYQLADTAIHSIPYSAICDRAATQGMPLSDYAPLDRLSQAYRKVAHAINAI